MTIPDKKDIIGPKSRESYIKKHYEEFYKKLNNDYPTNIQFKEKLYWYFHNITSQPVCKICGKPLIFKDGYVGYGKYCSKSCSFLDPEKLIKSNQTKIEKYGSLEEFYKVRNIKSNQTKIEKYGSLEEYEDIRQYKIKQTNIKKYGVEYPLQDKDIQYKIKQTNLERYGSNSPLTNIIVRNKTRLTNLERYGIEHYTNNKKAQITRVKSFISKHDGIINCYHENGINNYSCKCTDKSCALCENKCFNIPCSVYHTRKYQGIELCTIKNPLGYAGSNTSIEIFIKDLLNQHNIPYVSNDRTILNGKELDIYIPSKNIAIECNGCYWHSSINKDKDFHIWKFKQCQSNNIHLLQFWEDQIKYDFNIIESIILSKLGIYKKRIYARNCIIKTINNNECVEFLKDNHLQHNAQAAIKLGLYYNDELISIMTFSKSRKFIKKKDNEYELVRFCNKLNTQIIGGASKLFKYFLKHYNPSKIKSFSSNDISLGNLYEKLGFEKIKDNIKSYWYIDKKTLQRYHRYKFRKSELIKLGYDKNLSEFQIMQKLPYYKIYDSGQTVWEWRK